MSNNWPNSSVATAKLLAGLFLKRNIIFLAQKQYSITQFYVVLVEKISLFVAIGQLLSNQGFRSTV